MFGNILLLQNHAHEMEGWAKNAICNFVTKAAVDNAHLDQQHIF